MMNEKAENMTSNQIELARVRLEIYSHKLKEFENAYYILRSSKRWDLDAQIYKELAEFFMKEVQSAKIAIKMLEDESDDR